MYEPLPGISKRSGCRPRYSSTRTENFSPSAIARYVSRTTFEAKWIEYTIQTVMNNRAATDSRGERSVPPDDRLMSRCRIYHLHRVSTPEVSRIILCTRDGNPHQKTTLCPGRASGIPIVFDTREWTAASSSPLRIRPGSIAEDLRINSRRYSPRGSDCTTVRLG